MPNGTKKRKSEVQEISNAPANTPFEQRLSALICFMTAMISRRFGYK
jgi:hypothetical protein